MTDSPANYTTAQKEAIDDAVLDHVFEVVTEAGPLSAIEAVDIFARRPESCQLIVDRLAKSGRVVPLLPEMRELVQKSVAELRPGLVERLEQFMKKDTAMFYRHALALSQK
jgi:hypothetical protein